MLVKGSVDSRTALTKGAPDNGVVPSVTVQLGADAAAGGAAGDAAGAGV